MVSTVAADLGNTVFYGALYGGGELHLIDPARAFDPDRFAPDRMEQTRHRYAFAPQGAGPAETTHRCAGLDYTTNILAVFTILLLRGYTWELPPQRFAYQWHESPPAPADGLHICLRAR